MTIYTYMALLLVGRLLALEMTVHITVLRQQAIRLELCRTPTGTERSITLLNSRDPVLCIEGISFRGHFM